MKINVKYRSVARIETLLFHIYANEHTLEATERSLDECGIRLTSFEEIPLKENWRGIKNGIGLQKGMK